MQLGHIKDIDWEYLGALFARTDDNNQALFLKSFVKECGSWGTRLQVEKQLAGINIKLSEVDKEVLSMITYREEQ